MSPREGMSARVTGEELAERRGMWCEVCLLPSRCEWDFAVILDDRLHHTYTYGYCVACGTEWKYGVPA